MTRTLSTSVAVPGPVEDAYAALSTGAWPAALDAQLSDGSELVSADATPGGGAALVYSRRLPDAVPTLLRRFLPADGRVTQRDTWDPPQDGRRRATWEAGFPGMPGTVGGTMLLERPPRGPGGASTAACGVKVPLVGGQIEAYLAPLLEQLVAKQGEVLTTLLSR